MLFWLLTFSYWVHLLMTVMWLGGLVVMGLIAWPAWREQTLADNVWLTLQQRLLPWINVSMVLLWITGFIQMTNDAQYNGFLAIDSTWAWAMLFKHVAVIAMTGLGVYVQTRVYPAMQRVELLRQGKPQLAAQELAVLQGQEIRLLRVNLVCAVVVLFFTAMATAT